jgi:CYTH domain-containing protein
VEPNLRPTAASRYARHEREQRWLLGGPPHGCRDPAEIVDRYLTDTRLRLRVVRRGATSTYKLGHKVRLGPGLAAGVHHTTMYLTAAEHEALEVLPASVLRKVRWTLDAGGRRFAVDVFGGALGGLVLAEIELGPGELGLELPAFARRDVTDEERFTGGALADLSPAAARRLARPMP